MLLKKKQKKLSSLLKRNELLLARINSLPAAVKDKWVFILKAVLHNFITKWLYEHSSRSWNTKYTVIAISSLLYTQSPRNHCPFSWKGLNLAKPTYLLRKFESLPEYPRSIYYCTRCFRTLILHVDNSYHFPTRSRSHDFSRTK